ncbi:hypothetical protein Golob_008936 [Gossypium lobatum]|uniref:Protein kinase domain-containing protein n=2 Tax=Gossypium TaxID=3633 RepID=A0A7J8XSW6_GOSAI|nr:hypothetical protein [Gossypium lobatum]MBA0689799.1 hypothetical protein [Gossypium aridum]
MSGIFRSIFSALHVIYWLLTGFLNAVLQDDIRREAQTMSLIDHPNVIWAYCSFVVDHNLWVVMPFMSEGSCLHLMKSAYPDGFEEPAIGSVLKETLKALDYLHRQGHIHRDVKVSALRKLALCYLIGFTIILFKFYLIGITGWKYTAYSDIPIYPFFQDGTRGLAAWKWI